jgi:hypothetical protein
MSGLAEKIEQLVAIDSQCGAGLEDLGRLSKRTAGQHRERSDDVARSSHEPTRHRLVASSTSSVEAVQHAIARRPTLA